MVFGIVVGYTAKIALRASEKRNYIDKRSFLSFEIALAVRYKSAGLLTVFPLSSSMRSKQTFTLGISAMLDLASFLAVFVTGLVFAWDGWFTEETMEAHVQEVVDNLINLTFFIYFGMLIRIKFPIAHSSTISVDRFDNSMAIVYALTLYRLPILTDGCSPFAAAFTASHVFYAYRSKAVPINTP